MSLDFSPTLGFVQKGNFVDSIESKVVSCQQLDVDGPITVDGTSAFTGNLAVTGTASISGATTTGALTSSSITVTGQASFAADMYLGNAGTDIISVAGKIDRINGLVGNTSGVTTIYGLLPNATRESLSANGAISPDTFGTNVDASGGNKTMTLADGSIHGQLKKINNIPGATTNTVQITLATSAGGSTQDVITLTPPANNIMASVTLMFIFASGWRIVDIVNGTFA
jgi:hypothetical protein